KKRLLHLRINSLSSKISSYNNEFDTDTDIELDINLDTDHEETVHININEATQETLSDNNSPSIVVGQMFANWNDVERHINVYALKQGFATRLDHTEKNLGITIRAEIVCCHAGIANSKSTGLRNTKSIAIGCQCKIVICWSKTKCHYYVKSVNLEHNHPMDTAVAIFDPGYCKLSNSEHVYIRTLYDSGVPIPTIIRMLNEEYGRYVYNKDVYNSLSNKSRNRVKGLSQIAELLSSLHNKNDYLVTYSINNNKLHCLFFATQFELTKFNGINSMGITFLIACGLFADETEVTFCWILCQLKQAIDDTAIHNIKPILTDKDLALLSAIRTEMSHVKHQLCTWHVEQNIVKNLSGKLKDKFVAFSKDFKVIMTETVEDRFIISWDHLLVEYPEACSYMEQ
ncbi:7055_t:CDS:2, partial [Racocetra persica]